MTPKEIDVLNYINVKKVVRTDQLSEKLLMSVSTVRRILDRLDQQHRIIRFHGGASAITEEQMDTQLSERFSLRIKAKDQIARTAAGRLTDGSTAILLGGTTVSYMCKYLKGKTLTIITNSMLVLEALKYEKNVRLILLGGFYDSNEAELRGSLANSALRQLGADMLFSGTTGFDEGRGFLSSYVNAIELYDHCFRAADKVYMLADSSKYRRRDNAVIARSTDVDCLISDSGLPLEAVKRFQEQGVEVLLADREHGKT